jgi:hypothetical protein
VSLWGQGPTKLYKWHKSQCSAVIWSNRKPSIPVFFKYFKNRKVTDLSFLKGEKTNFKIKELPVPYTSGNFYKRINHKLEVMKVVILFLIFFENQGYILEIDSLEFFENYSYFTLDQPWSPFRCLFHVVELLITKVPAFLLMGKKFGKAIFKMKMLKKIMSFFRDFNCQKSKYIRRNAKLLYLVLVSN